MPLTIARPVWEPALSIAKIAFPKLNIMHKRNWSVYLPVPSFLPSSCIAKSTIMPITPRSPSSITTR
jgi:hypothetical protein